MTQPADNPTAQVLIVDDEPDHAEVMGEALRRLGHVCTIVHGREAAEDELRHGNFDLVVTDLVMQHEDDGLKVLQVARQIQANAETIMVTAHGDVATATAALKAGAFHFIEKPLDLEVFRSLCDQAIRSVTRRHEITELRDSLDEKFRVEGIIGNSPATRHVKTMIRQVAQSDIPVLITGESGTGKELVARAIHRNSNRSRKNFRPLNCAGLSESILESELFGHVRGAFTGAERDRIGVFEYADGGTLFLDEIGDMPMSMQAKLLRVLESGEIVRVGSNEPIHVNVRVLSATNHVLEESTSRKMFREDLYFRIRGAHINLPPLRERQEDIRPLVHYYADHFARQMKKGDLKIDEDVMIRLLQCPWPGNIRELINAIQNMVIVCDGGVLETRHIPMELREASSVRDESRRLESLTGMSLEKLEKHAIRNTLHSCGGNREQAAKILGIGERTLYRKLKEYGLK